MGISNVITASPVPDSDDGRLIHATFGLANVALTAATIIPAVSGKRIYVHGLIYTQNNSGGFAFFDVTPAGATIAFCSGSSNAYLSLNSGTPLLLPYQQFPWFTCAPGDSFCVATNGGTIGPGGTVMYVQG